MKYLLNAFLFVLAMLYTAVIFAFGWKAFVVPLGVPMITPVHALGLSTFIGFIGLGTTRGLAQLLVANEATVPYLQSWVTQNLMKTAALVFMLLFSVLM